MTPEQMDQILIAMTVQFALSTVGGAVWFMILCAKVDRLVAKLDKLDLARPTE